MRIGVPKETKTLEGRVALVPAAAGDLVKRGHEVWIEKDAGIKSGFKDEEYTRLGVNIAADAAALYAKGELIVKVKEPIAGDLALLRKDHLLFCYLHLAAEPALTKQLLDIGLTGVAFETVELPNGDRWRHGAASSRLRARRRHLESRRLRAGRAAGRLRRLPGHGEVPA